MGHPGSVTDAAPGGQKAGKEIVLEPVRGCNSHLSRIGDGLESRRPGMDVGGVALSLQDYLDTWLSLSSKGVDMAARRGGPEQCPGPPRVAKPLC